MPLMAYSPNWTPAILDADISSANSQANGDLSKVAGLLNKQGWSVNDFNVRDYIQANYPALYTAWKAKYGSFFKMDPMWIGLGVIALGLGFYAFNKSYKKDAA